MDATKVQTGSYKQLIEQSFHLYRKSFNKVIVPSLLVALTIFFPRILFFITGSPLWSGTEVFTYSRLWIVLIDLISIVFFVWILWHVHCVQHHKREPWVEDLSIGLKKALWVFLAAIFQSAIMFGIIFCLAGLGILLHHYNFLFSTDLISFLITATVIVGQFFLIVYVATLFIFLVPIIATENKNIFISLEKSILLAWNHPWRIASLQVTPWLLYLFIFVLIRNILRINIPTYFLLPSAYSFGMTIFQLILSTLFIPWIAALLLVQLTDLENRKKLVAAHGK